MTVQSIDKRLTPEANMTPAAQDKQQGAVSVEDAFVALLQQTTQRFGNNYATVPLAGKLLSETVTRTHMELKADRAQAARDDSPGDRSAGTAKDSRAVGKADKPRQGQGNAPVAKKADAKADAPTTADASDDEPVPVATADDGRAATETQNDDQPTDRGDDQNQTQQPEQVAAAPVAQDQVVIEIDIEETVQVIQVDTGAQAAQANADAPLQADAGAAGDTGAGKAADAKDALAGLNKDDRQRIADLQNKIVDDLQAGDADAALDAATELVSQLIDKANLHQMGNSHQQGIGQTAQAQDLANMVAGAGVTLDITVQTNQTAIDTTAQNAATVVDAMTLMDLAAMGQQGAGQGQTSQQNTQGGPLNQGPAPVALQAGPVVDTAQAAPVADDTRAFSSVLAAQVEASAPTTEQTTTQQPVTALAGIGATQAPDKAAAAPQAAPAARAPRVPLQQQVMEQINVQIDKAVKDGVDTVKIQLKPLDLGKIEIKLEVIDGRVSATVTADKPETLALLQKDSKGLEKALEDAGLKPEANSTSFSLRGGEHQQNADRGNTNQRSGRNRGRGQGLAGETASVGSAPSAQSKRPGFRSGVDISV